MTLFDYFKTCVEKSKCNQCRVRTDEKRHIIVKGDQRQTMVINVLGLLNIGFTKHWVSNLRPTCWGQQVTRKMKFIEDPSILTKATSILMRLV